MADQVALCEVRGRTKQIGKLDERFLRARDRSVDLARRGTCADEFESVVGESLQLGEHDVHGSCEHRCKYLADSPRPGAPSNPKRRLGDAIDVRGSCGRNTGGWCGILRGVEAGPISRATRERHRRCDVDAG